MKRTIIVLVVLLGVAVLTATGQKPIEPPTTKLIVSFQPYGFDERYTAPVDIIKCGEGLKCEHFVFKGKDFLEIRLATNK